MSILPNLLTSVYLGASIGAGIKILTELKESPWKENEDPSTDPATKIRDRVRQMFANLTPPAIKKAAFYGAVNAVCLKSMEWFVRCALFTQPCRPIEWSLILLSLPPIGIYLHNTFNKSRTAHSENVTQPEPIFAGSSFSSNEQAQTVSDSSSFQNPRYIASSRPPEDFFSSRQVNWNPFNQRESQHSESFQSFNFNPPQENIPSFQSSAQSTQQETQSTARTRKPKRSREKHSSSMEKRQKSNGDDLKLDPDVDMDQSMTSSYFY